MSFFEELKRRNVFRVGIAYLIMAWLVLQVTDIVVPIIELPEAFSKGVLLLLAIGLPIAIILAWAYEMTPEGVKKEKDVDRTESVTHRRLDFVIIGVLTLALAIFALDKFVWSGDAAPAVTSATEQQTLAVLPFINMSSDEEQEYFSDGLTEELLNLLARIPELRVTSRSSAFYYKGKDFKIADIGRELGVGHILEGSVRRSGETIRITAQLINVADDSHIWSETWDRTFDDIFVIQDEIAEAVVGELKVRLAGQVPQVADTDPEAYSLYLRARHLVVGRSVQNYEQAMQFLQAALAIDSGFVAAWLELGSIYWDGRGIGMFSQEEAIASARDAANKVLRLDPDNAGVHMLLAHIAQGLEMDMATASREIRRALELNPNDAAIVSTAGFVAVRIGDFDAALELIQKAKLLDPVGVTNRYGMGLSEMGIGRLDEAEDAFRKKIELAPAGIGNHQRLALVLLLKGQYDAALEEANMEPVEARRASVRSLIFQTTGDLDQAIIEHDKLIASGERWTYEIARMYAYRGMADEAFHWLERALARNDPSLWFISWDPFLDNIRNDPRFAVIEAQLGINRE